MSAWMLLMILDQTSEPLSQPQLNVFVRVALVMVSVHSSKTLRHLPSFMENEITGLVQYFEKCLILKHLILGCVF